MAGIAIVGGGVVGCATAYYLSKEGANVTLLERGELAGEATGAAAGILTPAETMPGGVFRDLCAAGAALYPSLVEALRDEIGIDVQHTRSGVLLPAENEGRAHALRSIATGASSPTGLEWVEGETLHRLEPALTRDVLGAAYSSDVCHVNPGLVAQGLAQAAASRGAAIRPATAVSRFETRGDRVTGVRTSGGNTIAADVVVLAAGPWTGRLAARLGASVPTRPMRGQMLAYRSGAVRHVIWGESGYLVVKAGGFVFAGATVEDVGFRPRTTARGLAGLRRMASALAPALRHAEVASAWAGLRPGSPDGRPIMGPLPGWRNVYVATGHFRNGILLGPITGKLIAQLITTGETEPSLSPFSAGRFGS
ncbi:MAG: glycine oxidase ThiO [Dehalococcoidia bacterium]